MTAGAASSPGRVRTDLRSGVLHAVLEHPRRLGALTSAMYDELAAACRRVSSEPGVQVLVLEGTDGAFAAGTDVRMLAEEVLGPPDAGAAGVAYERRVGEVLQSLQDVPVPVVAVVDGPAAGAGLALVACSDVVVAGPRARFGLPVARTLGNCVPASVVAALARRAGPARTRALLLTSRMLDAREAGAVGLADVVLEAEELDAGVRDLLDGLRSAAPLALAAFKQLDRRLAAVDLPDDEDLLRACYGSSDFREGVTAFLDRRPPRWEGR
ncbi:enoyl-CoA hydratase-related protein [uncultured Pseudokineococcus sp.]|uniref:enoyl-CoA hydratase-related protein n=1 Tax=uncultured Pseudokineococcus sp. TaxID=1642928 RepID=UPI002617FB63|nr:enoyl-CoA hydratase-related protein [uncultured Pseudokineococcus sp.]